MGRNQPWSIWWDFKWSASQIKSVVIETDHPKHRGELMRLPIADVEDENGHVDEWVLGPFRRLEDALMSGRVSINKWAKAPTMDVDSMNGTHKHA